MYILKEGSDEHGDLNLHCSDMPTCTFSNIRALIIILTVACFPVMQLHFYELLSVVDIAHGKTNEWYECGYKTFDIYLSKEKYRYVPRYGILYDRCTETKKYFCYSRKFRCFLSSFQHYITTIAQLCMIPG